MKLLVAAAILAAACGAKPPATTTTTTSAGEESAAAALPDLPFDQLNHEQRIEFMKQKVVPAMKPVFQSHDASSYAEFGCQTCHGAQAKEGHFDMPNPDLPKLNLNDLNEFFKQEDIDWMKQQVVPAMAKTLGVPVYSQDNPSGFGCPVCHTLAQ